MGATQHTQHTRSLVLKEFKRTGRLDLACAAAGCDRTRHYAWLRKFPKYAEAFEEARQEVAQLLEDEAVRRAYQGTMKPVNIGGKIVMLHEFSDQLLIFLLKNRNRPVFGERVGVEHSGKDGEPIKAEMVIRVEKIGEKK
jgi:hypothetical protein